MSQKKGRKLWFRGAIIVKEEEKLEKMRERRREAIRRSKND